MHLFCLSPLENRKFCTNAKYAFHLSPCPNDHVLNSIFSSYIKYMRLFQIRYLAKHKWFEWKRNYEPLSRFRAQKRGQKMHLEFESNLNSSSVSLIPAETRNWNPFLWIRLAYFQAKYFSFNCCVIVNDQRRATRTIKHVVTIFFRLFVVNCEWFAKFKFNWFARVWIKSA